MRLEAWDTVEFEELFAVPLRNGLNRPKKTRGAGVKMVNMGELFAHARIGNPPMDRVPLADAERGQFLLEAGDLLFARQSLVLEGAGKCSLVLPSSEERTFEGHVIRVRLDPDKADPGFYYYLFRSPLGRALIGSIVEQVAAAGIRGSDLRRSRVPYPPPPEQRAIGRLLGALDDKIELNRRMSNTLESSARLRMAQWLVDSARSAVPLEEVCEITMGQSPPGETYNQLGEGVPFYQGARDFGFRFPMRRVYCTAPTRFAKTGDTLLTVRAPVGRLNRARENCAVGRGVAAVHHRAGYESFAFYLLRAMGSAWERLEAGGTVFGAATKKDLATLVVPSADRASIQAFEAFAEPLDGRIACNEAESATLAALRDALLPKLMSGEIRVPQAEQLVERVT